MRSNLKLIYMKVLFAVLWLILLLPSPTQAETIIKNSVSVSSNGSQNTAQIKTIINGQVVEDTTMSSSSPLSISSRHTVDGDGEIQSMVSTNDPVVTNNKSTTKLTQAEIIKMKALIEQLQMILKMYENLLKQNQTTTSLHL